MGNSEITEMGKLKVAEDGDADLFTVKNKGEVGQLCIDTRNCTVQKSAFSSTVCEQMWFDNYLNVMSEGDSKWAEATVGQKTFKVVGGERLESEGKMHSSSDNYREIGHHQNRRRTF